MRKAETKIDKHDDTSEHEGERKYGDVEFADTTNKKYPIDTPEHIRAAWSYINHKGNGDMYHLIPVTRVSPDPGHFVQSSKPWRTSNMSKKASRPSAVTVWWRRSEQDNLSGASLANLGSVWRRFSFGCSGHKTNPWIG